VRPPKAGLKQRQDVADRDSRLPAGGMIVDGVQRRLALLPEVDDVAVEVTFDPRWTPERISTDGRVFLGW
jgi:metal-sulfur cluster biosynthetic enzyme